MIALPFKFLSFRGLSEAKEPGRSSGMRLSRQHEIFSTFRVPHLMLSLTKHADPGMTDLRKWMSAMLFVIIAATLTACQPQHVPQADTTTIYLVRHAEKAKGDNPGLTEAGQARAHILRDKLKDKNIDTIYSTHYRRTLETAQPLADELGKEIIVYNPRDLNAFADQLKSKSGTYLVVGHSNTTPQLAAILSGEAIEPMPETEYDRFVTVRVGESDEAELDVIRYGASP